MNQIPDVEHESDIFHEFHLYLPKIYQQEAQDSTKIAGTITLEQVECDESMIYIISAIQSWGKKTLSRCQIAPAIPLCDDIRGNAFIIDLVVGTIMARLAYYSSNVERFRSQSKCYEEIEYDEITKTHHDVRKKIIKDRDHQLSFEECYTIWKKYLRAIQEIYGLVNVNEINLYAPLILNSSRALIDNQFAAIRSTGYLDCEIKYATLSPEQVDIINKVKQFLRQVIQLQAVEDALKILLNASPKYSQIPNAKILQQYMMELVENHVYFIEQQKTQMCSGFVALCGIVISRTKLFVPKDNNDQISARLVILFFHESAHYIFRKAKEDFAWATPRHTGFDDLECGYLFEQILFGSYQYKIWNNPHNQCKILTLESFKQPPPILAPEDLRKQLPRDLMNPRHSGLCIADEQGKEL